MPSEIKFKLSEIAKDLNLKNKEVVDLIKSFDPDRKLSSTSSLTEGDLNGLFSVLTEKNAVKDMDSFFAQAKGKETAAPAEKPEKKPAPKKEKSSAPKTAGKPAAAAKKDANTAQKDSAPKANQPDKNAGSPKNRQTNRTQAVQNKFSQPVKERKPQQKNSQKPQNNNQQRMSLPNTNDNIPKITQNAQTDSSAVTRRTVDTRGTHVELDKYNEKYDKLAQNKVNTDTTVQKQKLTQRSQQYRKPRGMRKQRESEAQRMARIQAERQKKQLVITIPEEITISEFALRAKVTSAEIIKKLMFMGMMVTLNDTIDFDTAEIIASEFHIKVEKEVVVTIEERIIDDSEDEDTNLVPRSPVVVVMGHVDHGKTSILDAIRSANVASGEAGGITQHIGAYTVDVNGQNITFLDTPGHAAFTTMRARGASMTDIAILVVAADDGIMPQTIEAINHAKAAEVSIIVAINKMDKETANPDVIKQQLTEHGLVPEEWGGDVMCVPVSAKTGMGMEELLENVVLVAEMKELKANPERAAKGSVIEARLDKGRGPIATVLVQNGTLHAGDIIVAGTAVGRVRAMINDKGERVETAGPSIPVEITGLDEVPSGGDIVNAVSDERLARELVEQRRHNIKEEIFKAQTKVTLDNLFDQMQLGEVKELKVIVKADVNGSVEAVRQSLLKLSNDEVRVNVIHGGVGAISESDVMLASASNAIIVGFNVRPDPVAMDNAERDGVDVRLYRIIYECIQEIESAMKGMLAPKYRNVELGRAEVRQVMKISSFGTIAGSYITQGMITRNALIRVVRDGIVLAENKIVSLRRFKDDVKEVKEGYECGVGLENFNDIKEGDILEAFIIEEYRED